MEKNYKKCSRIGLLILLVTYFAAAYIIMNYYGITCIFLELFKIPCPGCGMTRAFVSLLKLDVYSAVIYNIVIFFMPYVFMYIFFDFKHKIHKILLYMVAAVAIVNWIIKINLFI